MCMFNCSWRAETRDTMIWHNIQLFMCEQKLQIVDTQGKCDYKCWKREKVSMKTNKSEHFTNEVQCHKVLNTRKKTVECSTHLKSICECAIYILQHFYAPWICIEKSFTNNGLWAELSSAWHTTKFSFITKYMNANYVEKS